MENIFGGVLGKRGYAFAALFCVVAMAVVWGVRAQNAAVDPWGVTNSPEMPKYKWDPSWPKPLPNKWKLGGITGLAVDKDDNVWVLTRPNDTMPEENNAGSTPPATDCCRRPPSMIHIDKNGDVINSFDPPQGHGMAVDSQGFVYIGNAVNGLGNVRKYDPVTGQMVKELPRTPQGPPGGGGGAAADGGGAPAAARGGGGGRGAAPQAGGGDGTAAAGAGRGAAGRGGAAAGRGGAGRGAADPAAQAAAVAAFRAKYPPSTPMVVGGIEEVRLVEADREMYVGENYLGGRVLVFDMDTFAFKRGWGARGKPLAEISTNDADHQYVPNGPAPKDFVGHLTLNVSKDGLVYAADRRSDRIDVTDKQGKYVTSFTIAPMTQEGGSTGGVGFSTDKDQKTLIISDLTNNTIWFLNRKDGKILGRFGSMGENGGPFFFGLHMIAIDSKGDIYTGEVFNGERVQRFVPESTKIAPNASEVLSKYNPNGDQWSVRPAADMPRYRLDTEWPKALPSHWKMGGVTGLAVDNDDNVWVHNRPNDTLDIEGHRGLSTPTADCCVRPPSMIHIDKNGNTIGSFDPPQGHGMDVDSKGFIYLGNAENGQNTVHKYDSKSGKLVMSVPRAPENQPGNNNPEGAAAFRAKYPASTPMIVGQIEEVRLDEDAHELYAADSYLGGRVMVFDLDTFAFKRGWGAYGHKLPEMTVDPADRNYGPNAPMPKEFRGHLTLNFSNDGKVYAADRTANRIDVTDKQGKYLGQEFIIAPATGYNGSTGGVAFSADKAQKFLYISDLSNNTIWFLNRADGKIVGRMGSMGDMGGQFYGLHMIAVDSKNNVYTGEVQNGERVQRFVPIQ